MPLSADLKVKELAMIIAKELDLDLDVSILLKVEIFIFQRVDAEGEEFHYKGLSPRSLR